MKQAACRATIGTRQTTPPFERHLVRAAETGRISAPFLLPSLWADYCTENCATLSFQLYSVPQPGENIPIFTL
jgi:hypothetical protein